MRRLLKDGLSVRGLVEPPERAYLKARNFELATVNLADRNSIEESLNDTDVLFHTTETDLGGTQNVFEACIRQGVPHVVYLSSIAVYGLAQREERMRENSPYDPHFSERGQHTRSMIEADQYAAAIGRKTKLAVTIFRSGVVYGPRKPLPIAPLGFRLGKINVVMGSRRLRFPLTHLENLADAMAAIRLTHGLSEFIVIDDEDLTLGEYHKTRQDVEGKPTLFLPGWPVLFAAIGFEIFMWLVPLGLAPETNGAVSN